MHDPHDHHHPHDHDHHHPHDHDHHHPHAPEAMSFGDKLIKRLEHWHRHNEDHLGDYEQWVAEAERQGHPQVAVHLREVAALTRRISERLARALGEARSEG